MALSISEFHTLCDVHKLNRNCLSVISATHCQFATKEDPLAEQHHSLMRGVLLMQENKTTLELAKTIKNVSHTPMFEDDPLRCTGRTFRGMSQALRVASRGSKHCAYLVANDPKRTMQTFCRLLDAYPVKYTVHSATRIELPSGRLLEVCLHTHTGTILSYDSEWNVMCDHYVSELSK